MPIVFLLTGGNIGNTNLELSKAASMIHERVGLVRKASEIYRTEPWGNPNQQYFLNQVLEVESVMKPGDIMNTLLAIEQEMGRVRGKKWEPRVIDIDMLLYDNLILESDTLTLPHPHLHERNFVLAPLAELAPDLIHPVLQLSIAQLLQQSADKGMVEKM